MTYNLVERLRNNCSCNFSSTPCGAEEQCRNAFDAAARIEKLEAALRRYRNETPLGYQPHMIAHEMDLLLEGKDD